MMSAEAVEGWGEKMELESELERVRAERKAKQVAIATASSGDLKGLMDDMERLAAEEAALEDRHDEVIYVQNLSLYALPDKKGNYRVEGGFVGKEGVIKYLTCTRGLDHKAATKSVDEGKHRYVVGLGCDETQPAVFTDPEVGLVMNTYVKPAIIPLHGYWGRILLLLWVITGAEEPSDRSYVALDDGTLVSPGVWWVLNWSAAKFQKPTVRGMVAVLALGRQGCGKTTYGSFLQHLLGRHNCAELNGEALNDNFNSHYAAKLFINANEVSDPKAGDRLELADRMKSMITDEFINLKIPHAPRQQIVNRITAWLTSNHATALRIEGIEERRHTVFSAHPEKSADLDYLAFVKTMFDPVTKKPTADTLGELAALAYLLKNWRVDWDMASRPYRNEARTALAQATQLGHESFFEAVKDTDGLVISDLVARYAVKHGELLGERFESADFKSLSKLSLLEVAGDGITCQAAYYAYGQFAEEHGTGKKNMGNFTAEWNTALGTRWMFKKRGKAPRIVTASNLFLYGHEVRKALGYPAMPTVANQPEPKDESKTDNPDFGKTG
jgi:hypothetical protein